ncbi:MAG: hypothetical protein M3Q73_03490 [bacterium]|nr:hypothetical protein [bacterium]
MILLYKYRGETPLQALDRLRKEQPHYEKSTLSYAGRLDPMAEGLLPVLVDSDNNEREKYLGLDKEYTVEVLFGIETDTGDVLGKIAKIAEPADIPQQAIESALKKYIGTFDQEYPGYSSQPVNGKPLYQWAREGKLDEITIPSREVTIHSARCEVLVTISSEKLLALVIEDISKVQGDFRQEEIGDLWKQYLLHKTRTFFIARITIACSSGTYMRVLAQNLGKDLNCGAIAYSIKRTKIATC